MINSPFESAFAPNAPGAIPVTLRDLDIGYRKNSPVLAGLSVAVVPGEVLAVVGPNGSGKTTLFRTLLGLLPPLSGEVGLAELSPADYRRRHGVGYLAEDTALPEGYRGEEVLALAAAAAGDGVDVGKACELAAVDYRTDIPVKELSKGMKRRLALAAALVRLPRLLLLDEPEAGLDPGQRIRLRDRIALLRDRMTILVASHDLGELALMSDRVLLIGKTGLQVVEQPPEGFTRDYLEELFLGWEGATS